MKSASHSTSSRNSSPTTPRIRQAIATAIIESLEARRLYSVSQLVPITPTSPGGNPSTAIDLGDLSRLSKVTARGAVGGTGQNEYFSFSIDASSTVKAKLSGLRTATTLDLEAADGTLLATAHGRQQAQIQEKLGSGQFILDVQSTSSAVKPFKLQVNSKLIVAKRHGHGASATTSPILVSYQPAPITVASPTQSIVIQSPTSSRPIKVRFYNWFGYSCTVPIVNGTITCPQYVDPGSGDAGNGVCDAEVEYADGTLGQLGCYELDQSQTIEVSVSQDGDQTPTSDDSGDETNDSGGTDDSGAPTTQPTGGSTNPTTQPTDGTSGNPTTVPTDGGSDDGSQDNRGGDTGSSDNSGDTGTSDGGGTDNSGDSGTDGGSTDDSGDPNGSDSGSTDNSGDTSGGDGGSTDGSGDNSGTDAGTTDNSGDTSGDNGTTDNSGDNGGSDAGSTDNSGDNSGTDSGTTDNSRDNGSSDNGSTDNSGSDNGSGDNSTDNGGDDTGSSDNSGDSGSDGSTDNSGDDGGYDAGGDPGTGSGYSDNSGGDTGSDYSGDTGSDYSGGGSTGSDYSGGDDTGSSYDLARPSSMTAQRSFSPFQTSRVISQETAANVAGSSSATTNPAYRTSSLYQTLQAATIASSSGVTPSPVGNGLSVASTAQLGSAVTTNPDQANAGATNVAQSTPNTASASSNVPAGFERIVNPVAGQTSDTPTSNPSGAPTNSADSIPQQMTSKQLAESANIARPLSVNSLTATSGTLDADGSTMPARSSDPARPTAKTNDVNSSSLKPLGEQDSARETTTSLDDPASRDLAPSLKRDADPIRDLNDTTAVR